MGRKPLHHPSRPQPHALPMREKQSSSHLSTNTSTTRSTTVMTKARAGMEEGSRRPDPSDHRGVPHPTDYRRCLHHHLTSGSQPKVSSGGCVRDRCYPIYNAVVVVAQPPFLNSLLWLVIGSNMIHTIQGNGSQTRKGALLGRITLPFPSMPLLGTERRLSFHAQLPSL